MSCDPRESRREGIEKAGRRLYEAGGYRTQEEATERVKRAVINVQKKTGE